MDIELNNRTGDLSLNGNVINLKSSLEKLPDFFAIGNEIQTQVPGGKVTCVFASTSFEDELLSTKVDLRFEAGVLVSIFIALTDKNENYDTSESFYSSAPEREALHLTWLKGKLGEKQERYTKYHWGAAGVAQDRSSDVHIFIHNRNNSWAVTT